MTQAPIGTPMLTGPAHHVVCHAVRCQTQAALGPKPRAPVSVMPATRLVVVAGYRRGQLRPGRPYLHFARRAASA